MSFAHAGAQEGRARQTEQPAGRGAEKPSEAQHCAGTGAGRCCTPRPPAAVPPPSATLSTLSLEPLGDTPSSPPAAVPASPAEAAAPPSAAAPGPEAATARASGPHTRPEPPRARSEAPPARPRAAAGASRSKTPPRGPISVDPATVRMAVLLAILLVVAGSMASKVLARQHQPRRGRQPARAYAADGYAGHQ